MTEQDTPRDDSRQASQGAGAAPALPFIRRIRGTVGGREIEAVPAPLSTGADPDRLAYELSRMIDAQPAGGTVIIKDGRAYFPRTGYAVARPGSFSRVEIGEGASAFGRITGAQLVAAGIMEGTASFGWWRDTEGEDAPAGTVIVEPGDIIAGEALALELTARRGEACAWDIAAEAEVRPYAVEVAA